MANTGKVFATSLLKTAAVYIIAFYIVFSLGAENNGSYLPNFLDSTPFRYHQMHTLELPLSIFILRAWQKGYNLPFYLFSLTRINECNIGQQTI